jgi:hypothetical protein
MHFRLAVNPVENIRIREVIPLKYCQFVKRFAKPYLHKSNYVNMLYQERNMDGFAMLRVVFYIKQPCLVIVSEDSPRTVIQEIVDGHMELLFKGQKPLVLQPGGYDILQLNTDEYALVLQPGICEMLRFEFEESVMKTVSKTATVKQWLDKLKSGKSAYYSHRPIDEKLQSLQSEMQYCRAYTEEEQEWFNDKLDEVFEMVTEQGVLK